MRVVVTCFSEDVLCSAVRRILDDECVDVNDYQAIVLYL